MRLRLVQASWWEVLIVGKTGSCCSGQGCALNPIICWWVGLHSLLISLAWGYPALESKSPACMLSCFTYVWLFATPWTVARQAPLSMGFSRKENWNGLPYPPPGDLPNPGIKPMSLLSLSLAGRLFTSRATWEAAMVGLMAASKRAHTKGHLLGLLLPVPPSLQRATADPQLCRRPSNTNK